MHGDKKWRMIVWEGDDGKREEKSKLNEVTRGGCRMREGDEEGWEREGEGMKEREWRDALRKGKAGQREDEVGGKERDIAWQQRRKGRKVRRKGGMKAGFRTKAGIYWLGDKENRPETQVSAMWNYIYPALPQKAQASIRFPSTDTHCCFRRRKKIPEDFRIFRFHTNIALAWCGSIIESRILWETENASGWYRIQVLDGIMWSTGHWRSVWVFGTIRPEEMTYCLLCVSCWRRSSQSSSAPSWRGRAPGRSTETETSWRTR